MDQQHRPDFQATVTVNALYFDPGCDMELGNYGKTRLFPGHLRLQRFARVERAEVRGEPLYRFALVHYRLG